MRSWLNTTTGWCDSHAGRTVDCTMPVNIRYGVAQLKLRRMTKSGNPPPNKKDVEEKGSTAFRRPRGFRCTFGRWHQSNVPPECMRFHGTLFFIFTFTVYI